MGLGNVLAGWGDLYYKAIERDTTYSSASTTPLRETSTLLRPRRHFVDNRTGPAASGRASCTTASSTPQAAERFNVSSALPPREAPQTGVAGELLACPSNPNDHCPAASARRSGRSGPGVQNVAAPFDGVGTYAGRLPQGALSLVKAGTVTRNGSTRS